MSAGQCPDTDRTHGPTGESEDFLTGFAIDNKRVWGRPAAVAIGVDGSLFVGRRCFKLHLARLSYVGH
jgi:glucose/arabinose dehydrogenase